MILPSKLSFHQVLFHWWLFIYVQWLKIIIICWCSPKFISNEIIEIQCDQAGNKQWFTEFSSFVESLLKEWCGKKCSINFKFVSHKTIMCLPTRQWTVVSYVAGNTVYNVRQYTVRQMTAMAEACHRVGTLSHWPILLQHRYILHKSKTEGIGISCFMDSLCLT